MHGAVLLLNKSTVVATALLRWPYNDIRTVHERNQLSQIAHGSVSSSTLLAWMLHEVHAHLAAPKAADTRHHVCR